jgi:hypothetical protein
MPRTLQEIADKLAWEGGLGEGFYYFSREIDSDDVDFNAAWRTAHDAFHAVEALLPDASEEE